MSASSMLSRMKQKLGNDETPLPVDPSDPDAPEATNVASPAKLGRVPQDPVAEFEKLAKAFKEGCVFLSRGKESGEMVPVLVVMEFVEDGALLRTVAKLVSGPTIPLKQATV